MNRSHPASMPQTVYVSPAASANTPRPLHHLVQTPSTNTACADRLREDPSADAWCLLWTDNQTAGRGRLGRAWLSQPGASLCLSVGRRLPVGSRPAEALPVAIGVSVAQALSRLGAGVQLKWPNDLLLGAGKLGGILCEASTAGDHVGTVLVAGVGINLHPLSADPLPCQGAPAALPLAWLGQSGVQLSAAELAPVIATAVADVLAMAEAPAALADLLRQADGLDAWVNRPVQVLEQGNVTAHGLGAGIDASGHYRIQTETGWLTLRNGELSLRSIE